MKRTQCPRWSTAGISLFLLLFFHLSSQAQLLWKISGNGLEHPSYLFGTHHAAPKSITDSISGFNEAFNACTQVFGEIIIDSLSSPHTIQLMTLEMICPPDSTLSQLLTSDQYARLDSAITRYLGVKLKQLESLKPAAINTQMSMAMAMNEFPEMQKLEQVDIRLQKMAKDQGKRIGALESVEFQTRLLYGAPIRQQVEELVQSLDDKTNTPETAREMADAYRKQDLDRLQAIIESEEESSNGYLDRIIYQRNRNWAAQMDHIMKKATFFAVGAGHLPGDQGVIELLRQKGYTVEAVW